jgi:hypothetical protein
MLFSNPKDSIKSVFCNCSAVFDPGELFEEYGFKWPDDIENSESIGQTKFQVINDLQSGLCVYNHEGNLHAFTDRMILQRQYKVKGKSIVERFGTLNPFAANNVYFLETGFNLGSVDFMIFDYKKDNRSSFRKTIHSFPLFLLMMTVLGLEERSNKNNFSLERQEKLENEVILHHEMLSEWQFMKRNTLASADDYRERVELPLRNYSFQRNDQVHISLKFEFFKA